MRVDSKNKDLKNLTEDPTEIVRVSNTPDTNHSPQNESIKLKKKVVRRAQQDGFFKTGVDVIEDEEIDIEGTMNQAQKMLGLSNISQD